ncbi:MazG-like family protein [Kitasatospora sp. NPDC058046]|uniref:MazG-like family protein n=1 Tax=Kitasatospora sp. NPDC058046 TaxID=3346312 RepID=UPI0036D96CB2
MEDELWGRVGKLRTWLDDQADEVPVADVRLLRILKVGEEFGEASEAVHGALGANPRKGRSHTWGDVESELADVIVTAMVALDTISGDGRAVLAERLRYLVERVGLEEHAEAG